MISWQQGASFSVFDVSSPFGVVVDEISSARPAWVVLEDRTAFGGGKLYAFRPTELRAAAAITGFDAPVTLAIGASLDATPATPYVFGMPKLKSRHAGRAVQLDAAGRVQMVGEVSVTGGDWLFRGPVRGGGGAAETSRGDEPGEDPGLELVDCLLSAQAPSVLVAGEQQPVDVRLELAEGAHPFAEHVAAALAAGVDVTALLFAEPPNRVERIEPLLRLKPPTASQPTQDAFVVRGLQPGPVVLTVAFRQGGSPLGSLELDCEVRARSAGARPLSTGSSTASPRDALEDSGLVLIVEERQTRDEVRYRYRVHSTAFGLNYEPFDSEPFRNAQGQASAPLAYVQGVYRRLETRALRHVADVRLFERELRGIGVGLCEQLLPAELVEVLWDHRDQIKLVEVNAGEPYVPWELLRLRHPVTREVDDRYLASYGLIRTFAGRMGPKALERKRWRLLVGDYAGGSSPAVGTERAWLLKALATRGLQATELDPDPHVLLDALADPDFDVLHVAVHGAADLQDISASSIVLSEHAGEPLSVDVGTVDAAAGRWQGKPLVFLNACQTGRQSPVLSDWGGWAKTFWDAGAGAFVGTSFSVRERPAAEFAEGFYEGLLAGKPLVEAAVQARERAARSPDASWLAYTVWGRPAATMMP